MLSIHETECEVGVRHRGAKSDTERSKQKKEKQNEVRAQVQVQVQVATRSKQKGQKEGRGHAQGRAEAQAQATVLVQEQAELFRHYAEAQAAVQAQAQVKGHTLARVRVADRHGGQLGQEQAQVRAEVRPAPYKGAGGYVNFSLGTMAQNHPQCPHLAEQLQLAEQGHGGHLRHLGCERGQSRLQLRSYDP